MSRSVGDPSFPCSVMAGLDPAAPVPVMAGLDPAIPASRNRVVGIRGSSPRMTEGARSQCSQPARIASSSSATMLVILIIGFTAGPAVSLYGSPTVSPVTAALWASEPLPP